MKKNKLAFSAGILLVIIASLSILMTLSYISDLITILSYPITLAEESFDADIVMLIGLSFCIMQLIVLVLQAIAFMILGVKLIKKTNAKLPNEKIKSTIILSLVFAGIALIFNFATGLSIMIIVTIVLLACSLSNNKQDIVVNENLDKNQEQLNESQGKINSQTESLAEFVEVNELKSEVDEMVKKAKTIKDLKDKGVLTQEEFEKFIERTLKIDEVKKEKKVEKSKAKTDSKSDKE